MFTMKKTVISTLAALAFAPAAFGDVTLSVTGGILRRNPTTPLPDGSLVVLLASTQNDSFGDLTMATNTFTVEADDIVLGMWAVDSLSFGVPGFSGATIGIPTGASMGANPNLTIGDDLLLVFYDVIKTPMMTGPGEGVGFGTFRTDAVISFSDIGWNMPADAPLLSLNFNTDDPDVGGDSPAAAGIINQRTFDPNPDPEPNPTIPEPSAGLMALFGAAALVKARRRNA
jgi:hypothetical protein